MYLIYIYILYEVLCISTCKYNTNQIILCICACGGHFSRSVGRSVGGSGTDNMLRHSINGAPKHARSLNKLAADISDDTVL